MRAKRDVSGTRSASKEREFEEPESDDRRRSYGKPVHPVTVFKTFERTRSTKVTESGSQEKTEAR